MAILHTKESALAKTKQRNFFLAAFFYGIAGLVWLWWVNNILFVHRILPFNTKICIGRQGRGTCARCFAASAG